MMMQLVTGVGLWMVAAVALGLLFGRAMHGYGVKRQPVSKGRSRFEWAA